MLSAWPLIFVAVLGLPACQKDDRRVDELRQRMSVLEARLAAFDKPPPAEWDDGCLTRVRDAVATARLFRTLDELVLGEGGIASAKADRFACVSDLTRRNLPAVARALDKSKRGQTAGEVPPPRQPVAGAAQHMGHVWDPKWQTRRAGDHGCWDDIRKEWQIDPRDKPQGSEAACRRWCRTDPCTWKRRSDGRPAHSAQPKLMALVKSAGLELGGPLTCLVEDVRLLGVGLGVRLVCRTLGLRRFEFDLSEKAADTGGPVATVNLGDLVAVQRYGRIAAVPPSGAWLVSEVGDADISIVERSSCCADPAALAAPSK